MSAHSEIVDLQNRMAKEIVGQSDIVERLVIGLLANGHLLVEGLPGLAKTRAIKALSKNLEGTFNRIQFTPDLISPDITGQEVIYTENGQNAFRFIKGPIFANIVLADEINRAPSKTQNALLEAMEERQVTVAGVGHKMPDLFLVMATQNPSDQAGTYPLPEAQMDRFLMHVRVNYPDEKAEGEIIRLIRAEEAAQNAAKKTGAKKEAPVESKLTSQQTIFDARAEINRVVVPEAVEKHIVDLIFATRYPQRYSYELRSLIRTGVSPRGSLALDRCARAWAWLRGRDVVTIDDVRTIAKGVLTHRIVIGHRAKEHGLKGDDVVDAVLDSVKAP
ncbi:MAG: MoxR family ATPase [Rhodospirillales bacterium]|nr:MoxR family ATPase [Rhodospirillales bacterium]